MNKETYKVILIKNNKQELIRNYSLKEMEAEKIGDEIMDMVMTLDDESEEEVFGEMSKQEKEELLEEDLRKDYEDDCIIQEEAV